MAQYLILWHYLLAWDNKETFSLPDLHSLFLNACFTGLMRYEYKSPGTERALG